MTKRKRQKWVGESTARDYPFLWKNNFAPEFMRPEKKCDPFKVDVYLLGAEISRQFLEVCDCFFALRGEGIVKLISARNVDRNTKGLNG